MTLAPLDLVRNRLIKRTGPEERHGMFRCPVHDDSTASLSVSAATDGTVLLHCHAGCDTDHIVDALGLLRSDLFASRAPQGRTTVVTTYDYRDAAGALLYQVMRLNPKGFKQRRPAPGGRWTYRLGDTPHVPYRLPELLIAIAAERWVVVVEGEKDVDRLALCGIDATCNSGGAGKWRREWAPQYFTGSKIAVVPDNDEPGRRHAEQVAKSLLDVAATVKIVELDGLGAHGDISDWLDAGNDAAQLRELVRKADGWTGRSLSSFPGATAQPLVVESPPLASDTRILDRFQREVRSRGLVGEERNAAILYLAFTSRLLDHPVSVAVKGHSSSGKSYTVESVTNFFPSDAFVTFTAMSQRALVFSKNDYAHRTLVVYEASGLRERSEDNLTSYLMRSLLSEGRIDYEITKRTQDGTFTTERIRKEGPTNLIFTTTATAVHAENETRVLSIHTDDSPAQTRRVLLAMATPRLNHNLDEWHQLQRWLTAGEHRVSVPFIAEVAKMIPPVAIRLRRDFVAVLGLIRAHALLHQRSRTRDEKGAVVATIDDYTIVRDLVMAAIAEGVDASVSPTIRETVKAVDGVAGQEGASVVAVAAVLGVDKSNASRRLRAAAHASYVINLENRRGQPARWVVGEPMPSEVVLLPPPNVLAHCDGTPVVNPGAEPLAVLAVSSASDRQQGNPISDFDDAVFREPKTSCSRCHDQVERTVSAYWDRALRLCPPCCESFAERADAFDRWPPAEYPKNSLFSVDDLVNALNT